jgi:hypothetical protein
MIVPLCEQAQHPRVALNPCLTRPVDAVADAEPVSPAVLTTPRQTLMHVDGSDAMAA